jgi:hypothetical protein
MRVAITCGDEFHAMNGAEDVDDLEVEVSVIGVTAQKSGVDPGNDRLRKRIGA